MAATLIHGAEPQPASITVDFRETIGPVNPWVFGGNMIGYQKGTWQYTSANDSNRGSGIWNPEQRCSVPEMVTLAKNAGLSVARWPGGCAVHLFDWKKTVGPVEKRPDQQFGLPEFLQNCADIGAVPLITLADYFGTAQDAADLVEYLNTPNDGRHQWAALRAGDGHAAPWNVVWFEYGNETEHGSHRQMEDFGVTGKMTAAEYARNYRAYRHAMRKVDTRIKLGAVIATGFPDLDHWAQPVLEAIGNEVDFVIHHSYKPSYNRNDGQPDARTLMSIGLAGADQIQDYYDEMNRLLREVTGRRDIPIAVTEFNGAFVQDKPVPYRHTLGNALINAEMLRAFLRPENHIVMANFWQFANEYWGAVKGYTYRGDKLMKRPQYYVFELYHNHFGTHLLPAKVRCGTYDIEGGFGVAPTKGPGNKFQLLGDPVALSQPWRTNEVKGVQQRLEADKLAVEFSGGEDVNYYHAQKTLPAEPNTGYRLTGWVKTEELTTRNGACFQIGDARGWPATKSAAITPDVTGTHDWTKVEVDYFTLADTTEIAVHTRRLSGAGPVGGKAWYRDVRVQKFTPKHFPAVPYLSVNASRSADSKKAYLMVVNKHLDSPIATKIYLSGFMPRAAKTWTLTGTAVDATNERDANNVTVRERDLGSVRDGFDVEFPPHSLTAIEIEGKK